MLLLKTPSRLLFTQLPLAWLNTMTENFGKRDVLNKMACILISFHLISPRPGSYRGGDISEQRNRGSDASEIAVGDAIAGFEGNAMRGLK